MTQTAAGTTGWKQYSEKKKKTKCNFGGRELASWELTGSVGKELVYGTCHADIKN